MSHSATVSCTIKGLREHYGEQVVSFDAGRDLTLRLKGPVGPRGISHAGADLLDFAIAVYQIERQLRGRQRTNPPKEFELRMRLRRRWTPAARNAASEALRLLGNADWALDLRSGLKAPVVTHSAEDERSIERVCLFSGGMDSTCGAATLKAQTDTTQLVSFYTRQMTLQQQLAEQLGLNPPVQFSQQWSGVRGRGRSFYYRSFLFLSLGAVLADSWNARKVLQFENGILASSIPPTPSWMMTKHAHPALHRTLERLFAELFGGEWQLENPFLACTKRQGVRLASAAVRGKMKGLLEQTQTCWAHAQSRTYGAKKRPGQPCGVCIPCVVRQTALPDEPGYRFDLRKDAVKNHKSRGRAFRSYFAFLDRVRVTGRSPDEFYSLLPASGRRLARAGSPTLGELHRLFQAFGREFRSTYKIKS